ncbi:vanadium-dependent haloperoxidase [Haloarchaeobius sp. DFWS5]|uniref:vanadium-dependent haloperoxidase n=1 Tax=Haloarchaeobius sp. DFWS5 TaxID=3446114 RepID=UPI003EBB6E12
MTNTDSRSSGVLRRTVLSGLGALGIAGTVTAKNGGKNGRSSGGPVAADVSGDDLDSPQERLTAAFQRRKNAAREQLLGHDPAEWTPNRDERRFGTRAAFTKGLPHDDLGVGDADAFEALLAALYGDGDFEGIPLGGDRVLANPQAAHSFDISGADSHDLAIPPAPAMDSPEAGAEMATLYWQSLLRDVPFAEYEGNELVAAAAAELSDIGGYAGATDESGRVTPHLAFRGRLAGSEVGPYLSQFFYHEVPRGDGFRQVQQYDVLQADTDYMTTVDEWLAVQRGESPQSLDFYEETPRHLETGRDLATYVHRDYPAQAYLDAALILLGLGVPFDENVPSFEKTGLFVDLGFVDVLDAVVAVSQPALHAAWVQKWLVHRRLRPEAFGGRVHQHLTGAADYSEMLPANLLATAANDGVLENVFQKQGTYLLSQAYPEGSPTHPSYPAGHSTLAGACVTVLKAYFDTDIEMPVAVDTPGETDESLTVGGELHKLAENMSIGRDWSGIHYCEDANSGYGLGEAVALAFLVDRTRTYDERYQFDGFTLTTFDGDRVRITPEGVVPADGDGNGSGKNSGSEKNRGKNGNGAYGGQNEGY